MLASHYRFFAIYWNISAYSAKEAEEKGYNNRSNVTKFDSLYKIRPLWNVAMVQFQSARNMGDIFTFDEAMVQYEGNWGPTTHMPNKPIKDGFKIDCLNEVNGYLQNSLISCAEPLKYEETIGKTGAVMYNLITSGGIEGGRNYLDENRMVSYVCLHLVMSQLSSYRMYWYKGIRQCTLVCKLLQFNVLVPVFVPILTLQFACDRFYTSVTTFYSFAKRGLFGVGTCGVNGRSFIPKDIMKGSKKVDKTPRGEVFWSFAESLNMVTWIDNAAMSVLSAHPMLGFNNSIAIPGNRLARNKQKEYHKVAVSIPEVVQFFIDNYKGTDKM